MDGLMGICYVTYLKHITSATREIAALPPHGNEAMTPWIFFLMAFNNIFCPEYFMNMNLAVMKFNSIFTGQKQISEISVSLTEQGMETGMCMGDLFQHPGQRRTASHTAATADTSNASQNTKASPQSGLHCVTEICLLLILGTGLFFLYRTRTIGIHFVTSLGADEQYRKLRAKVSSMELCPWNPESWASSWESVHILMSVLEARISQ